ncbi:MAG: C_GCAxxG_C_C family protein [Clostridia bacterium]|nr:C_GCAxxG_C_C family protein [Clostridia bacterium]
MKHSERAAKLFCEGYNCSQAVLVAFAEDCGLTEETAAMLASSFGGGMGRLREVCGAVSGMFMVAGLLAGYTNDDPTEKKDAHYALIQQLANEFKAEHSTLICRDLLGSLGNSTSPVSDPRTAEYYKVRPCVRFVITASDILDRHFFTV